MSFAPLAWRAGTTLLVPLLPLHFALRLRRGKEIRERLEERRGGGAARPDGPVLWLHAASVGETLSILPVIEAVASKAPTVHVLLTTGTVTSAELLARRLPLHLSRRVTHRFAPLDVPNWVARFLDGWRPDAGAFVESELWPNLLMAAEARAIPMALVNARMSARSAAAWRRVPGLFRIVLGAFRLILARSPEDAARLTGLGAQRVACWGDLKASAPPLPADPGAMAQLRALVGQRPVVLAASTHPGEDALLLAAHRELSRDLPDLLTIIVPRHPERGAAIEAEVAAARLPLARRASGGQPGSQVAVYIADTLGELGLFYRLAKVCVVGGSLVPHGGQNPLEPARLGCPIVLGPHMGNFAEPVARLLEAGGALQLGETGALAPVLRNVLCHPDHAQSLALAAATVADSHAGLPERVAKALLDLLPVGPACAPATERPGHELDRTNEV